LFAEWPPVPAAILAFTPILKRLMKSLQVVPAAALAMLLALSATAQAQKTTQLPAGGGGSSHVKSEWIAGGANMSITYGRPSLKGRPEAQMMPSGKLWRTGADVASILTTDKTLTVGAVTLEPGSYTINTEPGATEWKLVLGKLGSADQWGIPYKPELELGRATMTLSKNATSVEMLTFAVDPSATGGTLHIKWGTKNASVPFIVVK
jgi:hypothetical protein